MERRAAPTIPKLSCSVTRSTASATPWPRTSVLTGGLRNAAVLGVGVGVPGKPAGESE